MFSVGISRLTDILIISREEISLPTTIIMSLFWLQKLLFWWIVKLGKIKGNVCEKWLLIKYYKDSIWVCAFISTEKSTFTTKILFIPFYERMWWFRFSSKLLPRFWDHFEILDYDIRLNVEELLLKLNSSVCCYMTSSSVWFDRLKLWLIDQVGK